MSAEDKAAAHHRDVRSVVPFRCRSGSPAAYRLPRCLSATSGLGTYVLGISGGVDSLAAALLAQRAVDELRLAGYEAKFLAVRLPYGTQADESDAQRALDTIQADEVLRIDIRPAADAMLASIRLAGADLGDAGREDFLLGNIKARQRMIAQFALAGATRGLVIGTDRGRGTDGLFHQVR